MKTAFLVFRKILILCVFLAACSTAANPWQRVVVSALGLIYINIVSRSSLILSKIVATDPPKKSDPGYSEYAVNLFYCDIFAFVAAVQIIVAAAD